MADSLTDHLFEISEDRRVLCAHPGCGVADLLPRKCEGCQKNYCDAHAAVEKAHSLCRVSATDVSE